MKPEHNHYVALPILAWLLFSISCQKKEEAQAEPAKAKIEITSPKTDEAYKTGDTVHINAAISYTSQMHGYIVRVTDKASGTVFGEFEGHVHGDKFNVEEKWTDTVTRTLNLKIEISAIIDHDGNEAKAEVTIKNQP